MGHDYVSIHVCVRRLKRMAHSISHSPASVICACVAYAYVITWWDSGTSEIYNGFELLYHRTPRTCGTHVKTGSRAAIWTVRNLINTAWRPNHVIVASAKFIEHVCICFSTASPSKSVGSIFNSLHFSFWIPTDWMEIYGYVVRYRCVFPFRIETKSNFTGFPSKVHNSVCTNVQSRATR